MVHLGTLTATVPVGTQDPTASTEVWMLLDTQLLHETHTACFLKFADCSSACQNGGTCRSSSYSYCDCPSGYSGFYCQNKGTHACTVQCTVSYDVYIQWALNFFHLYLFPQNMSEESYVVSIQ